MPTLRLPLAVPTEPRSNDDLTKDALLQNAYIDKDPTNTAYVVKRPGFYIGSGAVTTGLNRGIYVNPNSPSGGVAGETEVFYIPSTGGAYLTSFSGRFLPPDNANGFRDFSFDSTINSSGDSASSVYHIGANSLQLRVIVGDAPDPNNAVSMRVGFAGSFSSETLYGNIEAIWPIIIGTSLIEVKYESGNINLYREAVLWISFPTASIPEFTSPSLSQSGSFPVNTNLQFI